MVYKVFGCDPAFADTAQFCEVYGFNPAQAANCILVASKSEPPVVACCIVLATTKLDVNKKVCQLLGVKKPRSPRRSLRRNSRACRLAV